jgi:hypothetical protein
MFGNSGILGSSNGASVISTAVYRRGPNGHPIPWRIAFGASGCLPALGSGQIRSGERISHGPGFEPTTRRRLDMTKKSKILRAIHEMSAKGERLSGLLHRFGCDGEVGRQLHILGAMMFYLAAHTEENVEGGIEMMYQVVKQTHRELSEPNLPVPGRN